MAKKATAKAAPKSKATPKAAPKAAAVKKVQKSADAKAKTPKLPAWLKPQPTDYVVGTEDYTKLVTKHNELFGTALNVHRVRPAVFLGIFQQIWKHYDPVQYEKNVRHG